MRFLDEVVATITALSNFGAMIPHIADIGASVFGTGWYITREKTLSVVYKTYGRARTLIAPNFFPSKKTLSCAAARLRTLRVKAATLELIPARTIPTSE